MHWQAVFDTCHFMANCVLMPFPVIKQGCAASTGVLRLHGCFRISCTTTYLKGSGGRKPCHLHPLEKKKDDVQCVFEIYFRTIYDTLLSDACN